MSQALTLQIPDDTYAELLRSANHRRQAPEATAVEFLSELLDDPLMRLAGTFTGPSHDVADRHDHYIGEGLATEPLA